MLFSFVNWIWPIAGPILIAALVYLVPSLREIATKYLTSFVQVRMDERIEAFRSELRKSEEKVKQEFQEREQRLSTIVGAAVGSRSQRVVALEARRLKAAEAVWHTKVRLDQRLWAIVATASSFDYEYVVKRIDKDAQLRQAFAELGKHLEVEAKLKDLPRIDDERLFVTSRVWAVYSAYSAAITVQAVQFGLLAKGVDPSRLVAAEKVEKLVAAVLPQAKGMTGTFGINALFNLLPLIEALLLKALSDMLEGKEADAAEVRNNADIVTAAENIRREQVKLDLPDEVKVGLGKADPS